MGAEPDKSCKQENSQTSGINSCLLEQWDMYKFIWTVNIETVCLLSKKP